MKALLQNDKVLKASIVASSAVPALFGSSSTYADCNNSANPANSDNPISEGANCAQANGTSNQLFGSTGVFHTIANILIYIVGAVAVIMLIIGGLRYVISQGDKTNVESAKNTILYSVIGIVVAILAYAIVNFVTGSLTPAEGA